MHILLGGMKTLVQDKCPIINFTPEHNDAIWLRPVLVATIGYLEFTRGGRLRQPSFIGLNSNMPAREYLLTNRG